MNKYQEAFDELLNACIKADKYDEKATPKKIVIKKYSGINIGDYYCPKCNYKINEEFEPNYCPECGQKLDWNN